MSERKFRYVGTRPIRHDGVDKVTGRALYGADFSLPGMLHGAVLRSPHAHARIVSIDTRRAEEMEGVEAVLTGADLPELDARSMPGTDGRISVRDLGHNCIARDRVLYHGHAVAAVAATRLEIAREALGRIDVVYERLEPVLSLERALEPDAPVLHEHLPGRARGLQDAPGNVAGRVAFKQGDLEQGFAEAEVVLEREFSTEMVHQGYIEPHACVARVGEDGQVVLWLTTQGPFIARTYCANVLGIEPGRIKVIPSEIGGGFGGKTTVYQEPLAIELARRAGRPVKMVMSREEVFRATGPTSGTRIQVKLGARRDGRLVAASSRMYYEAGAYPGSPAGPGALAALGSYRIPNFQVEAFDVVLNKPKVNAYRAPGAPMSTFATESLMDDLARELELDPIELRLKNASREGDRAPYGPTYGPIGLVDALEAVRAHPHYRAPLEHGSPDEPLRRGRGVAAGFWFNAGMQSSADVSLHADGSAVVSTGNPDIGGSRASLALMVAEELGIPVERVRPTVSDTDSVGYTDGTGGSRVTFATGLAAIRAAQDVIGQLRERAARIWGVEPDAVGWEEGSAVPLDGAKADCEPLPIAELARQMAATGGPVVGRASLSAPAAGPSFTAHLCDLEVDCDTGRSRVVRYTAVQDAGRAVHPAYVEGQIQGGAAQGIGWALNEEYVYDPSGEMANPGFLDYRMPVASDLPMIDAVIVEVPNPTHPYGVRGVGETPIVVPLAAVANAMRDATGVRFDSLPLSPPRVLEGLERSAGEGV
ncbi:MAG: xanthine dehydrogenase family protein molybdopterin-binding subunit [Proteobacteria bacterium]|nr:xanthine dehydrogenase family protein molybdopterin-binding subunit [Pseudomonadota bacterium]